MREVFNNQMDKTPGKHDKTGPKPLPKGKMTEAQIKATLTPAQQADYEQDCKDARLETWLSNQGREEESEQVYQRRMARAERRGDFRQGYLVDAENVSESYEATKQAAHAAFKAAWDEELRRERARQEVEAVFGPAREVEDRQIRMSVSRMMAAEVEVLQAPVEALVVPGPLVYDGTYTVIGPKGHRTLRIRRQKPDASFKPSVSLVGLLTGADNENNYTNFGHVQDDGSLQVWKRHENTETAKIGLVLFALLKMDAAGQRFAAAGYRVEVSKRCYRCHRLLTHPTSLSSGYGPECINL